MKKILLITIILYGSSLIAQTKDNAQTDVAKCLREISKEITSNYIFPDVAAKIDSAIAADLKTGKFNNLSNDSLAQTLTGYLRSISNDKHFFVKYLPDHKPTSPNPESEEQRALDSITNSLYNFGFNEVKRLEGNIGYIDFIGFAEPNSSEFALTSAMNFVSNTNSLIIDLRKNRGGDNGMLLLFCSYFLSDKAYLYETTFRGKGITTENWTKDEVAGKKYLNKPIYILTSKSSFSAAEGLPYVLQSYKLAKVVGEQTQGAANPVDPFIVDNKFLLLIPVGQVTSTVTKTNWEHVGVIPDYKVDVDKALTQAHLLALKEVQSNKVRTELSDTKLTELIKQLEADL